MCGRQKTPYQPIFLFNITENSQTSLANNTVLIGANIFKMVHRHIGQSYKPYKDLGQIDHNLHNHVFDDIICKTSIHNVKFHLSSDLSRLSSSDW